MVRSARQQEAKELDGFGEQDVIAEAAGLMAKGLSEVSFSHPGRAIEQNMFPFFNKGAVAQVPNQPGVEFGGTGEVKALQGFFFFEGGPGEP